MVEESWEGASAAGSANHFTWVDNPQFELTLAHDAEVLFRLTQPACDASPYTPIGLYVLRENCRAGFQAVVFDNDDALAGFSFRRQREHRTRIHLTAGRYTLVPATYEPGVELSFALTVLSTHQTSIRYVCCVCCVCGCG
jgi:Calpain large subunit, domain III